MTPLPKHLEEMRDKLTEKHYKTSGHVPTEWAVMNYQAGFNQAASILLKDMESMAKALEEINNEELNAQRPGGGYSKSAKLSFEALKIWREKYATGKAEGSGDETTA